MHNAIHRRLRRAGLAIAIALMAAAALTQFLLYLSAKSPADKAPSAPPTTGLMAIEAQRERQEAEASKEVAAATTERAQAIERIERLQRDRAVSVRDLVEKWNAL